MILTLDWTIKWIIFLAIGLLGLILIAITSRKKTYFSKLKYHRWLLNNLPFMNDDLISYYEDSHWAHYLDGKQVINGKIDNKKILKEWRVKKCPIK